MFVNMPVQTPIRMSTYMPIHMSARKAVLWLCMSLNVSKTRLLHLSVQLLANMVSDFSAFVPACMLAHMPATYLTSVQALAHPNGDA